MIVITADGKKLELGPHQLSVLDRAHCFKVLSRMARYRTLSLVRENTLVHWHRVPSALVLAPRSHAALTCAILVAPIVERCALGLTWADGPPRLP